ncbi:MAG: C10 family peptidase [Opitutaceae bacterium]
MKRLVACSVLLLFAGLSCIGAPVGSEQASQAARRWLELSPSPMGRLAGKFAKITAYSNAAGEARFYVVDLAPTGYIAVAADDEAEPILAFSHSDHFQAVAGDPLYDLLQLDTEGRIGALRNAAAAGAPLSALRARNRNKWGLLAIPGATTAGAEAPALSTGAGIATVNDVRVAPLLQSEWNQSFIDPSGTEIALFNYYTPPYKAGTPTNYYAGCVATAAAQIMRYHQWPLAGVGTGAFAITVNGVSENQNLLGGNGAGGPYDWADMVLVPGYGITTQQCQAIGALLHDAGIANNMAYTATGSGANFSSVILRNVFHYANASWNYTVVGDIPTEIRTNLDAGLPVGISIYESDYSTGHEPVCDGYGYNLGTLYNHLNMGWGGESDAWYNLPDVAAGGYNFTLFSDCTYNIDPTVAGEIISGRVSDASGNPLAGITITATGPTTYEVTTNQSGIFAIKGLPSNTTFTVSHSGGTGVYGPAQVVVTTGKSGDSGATGNRVVDNFQVLALSGSLQVTLAPQGAVNAGAKWQVDGGAWQSSGATVPDLTAASHTVTFSPVSGWITPASQTVTVSTGQTSMISAFYGNPPVVSTLAGSAGVFGSSDGTGSAARFNNPGGVAVDGLGNVYVADTGNYTVRKVTPAGVVTTLAGSAGNSGLVDGTGSAARFSDDFGIAVDGSGNVYVADTANNSIRKVSAAGVVTTLGRTAGGVNWPCGLAVDSSGNVYVAVSGNEIIQKMTPAGVVTTIAGSLRNPGSSDGTGTSAQFDDPFSVAVDGAGNLYVADSVNDEIRKITPAGVVTTLAGSAGLTGGADGTGSAAQFHNPCGVAVDGAGNVYVADSSNNTIRMVTPAGVVTTLAGTAGLPGSANGMGSAARFHFPSGVAVDSSGNIYVADRSNSTIRMLTQTQLVAPAITLQPVSQTVASGASASFTVAASGTPSPAYQWCFNGQAISGATSATLTLANVQAANAGSYTATAANSAGSVASNGGVLAVQASGAPAISTQPQPQTMAAGSTLIMSVGSSGVVTVSSAGNSGVRSDASPTTVYQWYFNGVAVSGATSAMFELTNVAQANAGAYSCLVSNSFGSNLSSPAAVSITTTNNPGRLINLSVNAVAGGASRILTVGFYNSSAGAAGQQTLLVQALGPALYGLGVTGFMPDPQLSIFNSSQSVIASNAGWGSPLSNQLAVLAADAATYATPLSVVTSKDSAIVASLAPGGYTIQVDSVSGTVGTTLAALYDDTPAGSYTATTPHLINISCRLQLGANGTLTAGFTVGGSTSKTVLIRASGPALLAQGVTGVMPDPQLAVYDASQNVIASDAGWGGSPIISSIASSVYAQAFTDPNSLDSAVALTLPPASYTVQASSASGAAGDVMIEVYEVP